MQAVWRSFVFTVIAGLAAPVAASDLFDACAGVAASKYEPGYEGVGSVGIGDFYAYDAIEACSAAYAETPDDIHVQAWLGAAYAAEDRKSVV